MGAKEITLGYPEQPKEEVNSPPLSPRSSDDDDETEPDDSEGEEEEGGAGAGAGTGGAAVVSGPPLKKGPWTPEEDKRLRTYVEAHGEGNWNQVQRNAGLNRCGKSCRLRWANHLRPHLKKGPFSEEEEQTIIELHAKHGNKWAQMASKLPGRTDNEIKNFWNTRSKRLKKKGQDLYPEGLLSRVKNQDMDSHSPDGSCGNKRPNELSQETSLELIDIKFENLDYLKRPENFFVPTYKILDSHAMNPSKRHASSDMVSGYGGSPTCEQFPHEPERTCYTDINLGIAKHGVPFNSAIANGMPILDGNFSTSGTMQRPMKMELPSLQNTSFESINSCLYHIPPATPLDLAETFISSPASVLMKPDCLPSQNMVQQPGQILGDSTAFQGAYEVSVPPVAYVYPLGPHSSVFNDGVLEGSPLDEFRTSKSPASLDVLLADGKHQADDIFADKYLSPLPDSCRPGASAGARYLSEDSPNSEYQPISDPFSAMLFGDSCDEDMFSAPGDGHQHRLESGPWNSMPGARHVPGS
ncbi:hypothetical protein ACQ4PT_057148 [Festuca glaucescens]